jgi:hypothetical protein
MYDALIVGSVWTAIILPKSAQLMREDTLLYLGLTCTLLCYKDIRKNGLHVEIHVDGKEESIYFTNLTGYGKQVSENSIPRIWIALYIHKTYIFVAYKVIF